MIPRTELERREQYLEKPLPSSAETERVIEGAILMDNQLMTQAIEKDLQPDDFYSPMHRRIYAAMKNAFRARRKN
jgi:replicative DNA helicase